MTDIAEIGTIYRFRETGDIEVLAAYIENGGPISDESRQVIADALRGIKPRKRINAERDARIIELMRFYRNGGYDGERHSVEESRAVIADAFAISEDRVKQIWERRG